MCGIVGIVSNSPVNQEIYDALTVLQHRGQDAAGIVTCDNGRLYQRKDNGMVKDVFRTRHMRDLRGNMGIGHVRYPTAGSASSAEAQPFYVNSPYGIAMGHNGNITNAEQLSKEIYEQDLRHLNTNSDSEVLLNIFAHELMQQKKLFIEPEDIFNAIHRVHKRARGGYAAVGIIPSTGLFAFRDPFALRPIVVGKRETPAGIDYMVASESVALDAAGFELLKDLEPGEAVVLTEQGTVQFKQCADNPQYSPCIFEFVYFARPDSMIDDISVYKSRLRMGEKLAEQIMRDWPDNDIDVVMPIPDTSRTSALQLADKLGKPYREGFIKNRYIGRTFIMPGQKQRKKSVRQKLNPVTLEFEGKNILLVDDSIVRGTTSGEIVQMARDAGAKKVYFASAAPAVRYPYVYGIDMPSASELVANGREIDEIADYIGADKLFYQDLDDLIEAVWQGNKSIKEFDTSCFSGCYVTGDITQEYLDSLDKTRNDDAQSKQKKVGQEPVGIYNGG
ncbi:Amidophosphoribosyltransferase [Hydrogenovibrio crunogenus]|uniref:Amidophosphoribosyltransferase n=1 Tax=Hydrogenovibrio crunogenus TaxID=39765 RepID=A0A4V1C8R6_9GAMM|nr:amidophosphoribosyltransferase [Hydrogenovibrio crunogenus]QBZ82834.1 Amidophosphoribosyltransferase [Hydrogenovibrio crunogenus]RUM91109.1 MAG: amidophosphoribosyltransferase [Thiomicrospira sp.]